ncbi:MAG: iron-sulfur cluster assembly accessory protein [Chamaesiphon sp.]|nr:iron-sulfur cluster assembly accessory protein [Chamaesiphon sp.]
MIEISQAAIAEIVRMQTVREQNTSKFQIGFARGGCNDFHYTIDLVDAISDRDRVYEINGVLVSIDLQQLEYLDNLKLDYSEDLMGGGFRFQNPLATSVCGCGNSFSMVGGEW